MQKNPLQTKIGRKLGVMTENVDVELIKPRVMRRQVHRENISSSNEEYFRSYLHLISEP